ncbi:MAG TPA: NUDIX domain-containing protein [Candidatus Saccharimonadales bacterium]|nr:NUDIX domain-containing protein [Candidatus Saccharimonadales bacterium]
MKQLHEIQLNILRDLLFSDVLRYSDIKPVDMENSQIVFHIDKLIENGLVTKVDTLYKLTDAGKEYANQIDTDIVKVPHAVKATTIFCAVRNASSEKEYLIYKRLKNPFYGCLGFPTEKPKWGETLEGAAKRGLKEEANLDGEGKLFAIRHYLVFSKESGEIVEDKLMHAFLFINPTGNLAGNIEGDYQWIKESELSQKVIPALEEFSEILEALNNFNGVVSFKELKIATSKF